MLNLQNTLTIFTLTLILLIFNERKCKKIFSEQLTKRQKLKESHKNDELLQKIISSVKERSIESS